MEELDREGIGEDHSHSLDTTKTSEGFFRDGFQEVLEIIIGVKNKNGSEILVTSLISPLTVQRKLLLLCTFMLGEADKYTLFAINV